jgi:hypothetical protein
VNLNKLWQSQVLLFKTFFCSLNILFLVVLEKGSNPVRSKLCVIFEISG